MQSATAIVKSPCRLSYTLIDLTGASGRKNGMASMVVDDPSFECTLRTSDQMHIEPSPGIEEYSDLILGYLHDLQKVLGGRSVHVTIDRPIPTHSGFGSKTNTLLSIGKGYAAVNDMTVPTSKLAEVAGRAGTSGGTVNLIDRGGFLVDGGHATPPDFDKDPNSYLLPSRYAGSGRRPPVLISEHFPADWPLLMIQPNGLNIHGQAELDFFKTTLPIPEEESHRTAHMVLMRLAPAIAQQDYGAFCNALNDITFGSYFKLRQIELQNHNLNHVVTRARANGIDAIGMSSMGPVCFTVTRDKKRATKWLDDLKAKGVVLRYWDTHVVNGPAKAEKLHPADQHSPA